MYTNHIMDSKWWGQGTRDKEEVQVPFVSDGPMTRARARYIHHKFNQYVERMFWSEDHDLENKDTTMSAFGGAQMIQAL